MGHRGSETLGFREVLKLRVRVAGLDYERGFVALDISTLSMGVGDVPSHEVFALKRDDTVEFTVTTRDDTRALALALDAERAAFPKRFGGGMGPFDTAYFAFVREHPDQPEAHAWSVGVAAILDEFVAQVKHRVAGAPINALSSGEAIRTDGSE